MPPSVSTLSLVLGVAITLPLVVHSIIVSPGRKLDVNTLPDLTDTCLGCICEATTNCNLTIGCMRGLCGPFLISRAYWIDSGRPTLPQDNSDRAGAYEACANDPFCAASAVKQYMARYAQDCNRDRILDCDDYARIHYLGGYQCTLPMNKYMYYHVFHQCRSQALKLNG